MMNFLPRFSFLTITSTLLYTTASIAAPKVNPSIEGNVNSPHLSRATNSVEKSEGNDNDLHSSWLPRTLVLQNPDLMRHIASFLPAPAHPNLCDDAASSFVPQQQGLDNITADNSPAPEELNPFLKAAARDERFALAALHDSYNIQFAKRKETARQTSQDAASYIGPNLRSVPGVTQQLIDEAYQAYRESDSNKTFNQFFLNDALLPLYEEAYREVLQHCKTTTRKSIGLTSKNDIPSYFKNPLSFLLLTQIKLESCQPKFTTEFNQKPVNFLNQTWLYQLQIEKNP